MKLILLCVRAGRAVLGSPKTALKFKYEIMYHSMYGAGYNSVSSVVEFPGAGLSRLRTINSKLNGAT